MLLGGDRLHTFRSALCVVLLLALGFSSLPLTNARHRLAGEAIPGSPYITDLTAETFNSTLLGLKPEQHALIEFYASWCPHCRHFGPEIAKAATFLGQHLTLDPPLFIGRTDCAVEVALCAHYKVEGYPEANLATVKDFLGVARANFHKFPLKAREVDAKHIALWVAENLNTTLPEWVDPKGAADEQSAPAGQATAAASARGTWHVQDVERATMQLMQQSVPSLKGGHARSALLDLLLVWSTAHPSSLCMEGASKLQQQLPGMWPADSADPGVQLRSFHICGEAEEREWRSCKGSKPDLRGYTCGLWTMWHSLAVRLPEASGGRLLLSALRAFAAHFFQCAICQQHFSQLLAEPAAAAVATREEGVMWLWETHNRVNARLAEEEKEKNSGDPQFPKAPFPSAELCPQCRGKKLSRAALEPSWDRQAVYAFLIRHYGPKLAGHPPSVEAAASQGSASQGGVLKAAASKAAQGSTSQLVLSLEGDQHRPSPSLSSQRHSRKLRTYLAILAMVLIMGWYCSKAQRPRGP